MAIFSLQEVIKVSNIQNVPNERLREIMSTDEKNSIIEKMRKKIIKMIPACQKDD